MSNEFVKSIYRLINEEHTLYEFQSIEIRETYNIYNYYPKLNFRNGIISNKLNVKFQGSNNLQVVNF